MRTIPEQYEEWLVGRGQNTIDQYLRHEMVILDHLKSWGIGVDTRDISEVARQLNREIMTSFKAKMHKKKPRGKDGPADASIRKDLSMTNVWLDFMERKDLTFKIPKRSRVLKRTPTREEIGRMIEASKRNPDYYEIMVWLTETGARAGEIRDVLDADVDLERGFVIFRKTKNTDDRRVRMTPFLIETIRKYREEFRHKPNPGEEKYFQISSQGNHLNNNFIWDAVKHVAVWAKIGWKITPHSFRRYKATDMYEQGVPVEAISKFLGHRSVDQTMEYINDYKQQKAADEAAERTSFFPTEATTTATPSFVIEESSTSNGAEPTDQMATAREMLLRREISEETFRIVAASLGNPQLEALK